MIILTVLIVWGVIAVMGYAWVNDTRIPDPPPSYYGLLQEERLRQAQKACVEFVENDSPEGPAAPIASKEWSEFKASMKLWEK